MTPNMYQLTQAYLELDEFIDGLSGDVTSIEAEIVKYLECLNGALEEKADNTAAVITELESRARVRREEADRLADLARADAEKAKRLEFALMTLLRAAGTRKIDGSRFVVAIQKNGGKRKLIVDIDPASLPERFQRVFIEANGEAIRQAIDAGENLEFARLAPQGERLSIK